MSDLAPERERSVENYRLHVQLFVFEEAGRQFVAHRDIYHIDIAQGDGYSTQDICDNIV